MSKHDDEGFHGGRRTLFSGRDARGGRKDDGGGAVGRGNVAASLGKMSPDAKVDACCSGATAMLVDVAVHLAQLEVAIRTRSFHHARGAAHEVHKCLATARRELALAGHAVSTPDERVRLVALDAELTTLAAQAKPLLARAPKPAAHKPEAQYLIAHGPELHAGHDDAEEERAWHAAKPEGQVIDASARFAGRRGTTIDRDPALEWDENRATLAPHESVPQPAHAGSLDPAPEWDENRATLEIGARPVQKRAAGSVLTSTDDIQRTASVGVRGSGGTLPHLDAIQRSFGPHDISGIQAHVGGAAADAAGAIGAEAYATGDHVAFAREPDLHTAAHEAAHVIQQRGGVQLKGGVGEAGDAYEQHADAVADRVVRGEPAPELLPAVDTRSAPGVQMKKGHADSGAGDADLGVEQAITRVRGVLDSIEKVLDTLDQGAGNASLRDALWSMLPSAKKAIGDAHIALAAQGAASAGAGVTGVPLPNADVNKLAVEIAGLEWRELQVELRAKQYPPSNTAPVDTIEYSNDEGPWGLTELVVHQTMGDPDPNRYERVVSQGPPGSSRVDLDIGIRDPSTRRYPNLQNDSTATSQDAVPAQMAQPPAQDTEMAPKEESVDAKLDKQGIIGTISGDIAMVFQRMRDGVAAACRQIRDGLKKEEDVGSVAASHFDQMIEVAGEAALATSATGVAAIVVEHLRHHDIAHEALLEGVKEALVGAIKSGASNAATSDGDLLNQFQTVQESKVTTAESDFVHAFGRHAAPTLRRLSGEVLDRIEQKCAEAGHDGTIEELQERNTVVQWTNYLARSHHGGMKTWDPWAAGLYGDDFGFPTDKAAPPPTSDGQNATVVAGNVDPNNMGTWLDPTQRSMTGDPHGVLEVFVWSNEDGSLARYIANYSEHGLRLEGVDENTRGMLSKMGTVGDVHINKVVHVYSKYAEGADLNPPKAAFSFVITADGYIRNWSGGSAEPIDASSMQRVAAFANSLSMSLL